MSVQRILYVTQESLLVWERSGKSWRQTTTFAGSDTGFNLFDAYLQQQVEQPSLILLDVIEEEFAQDTVPKLAMRDRKALMHRRLQRKFPRTPYRLSEYRGRKSHKSDESIVMHCAVSNHELLDPWLQVLMRNRTPLTGIFSVPLMAADLLYRFYKRANPVLFVTQHQRTKLRQVFLRSKQVQSARFSQSPEMTDKAYADFVVTEVLRSRRYLERTRLLKGTEELDVCMLADAELADRVMRCAASSSPLQFHFIDPCVVASRTGLESDIKTNQLEILYLASSARKRPKNNYAVSGETRYCFMRRARHALIGSALMVSAVCSVLAGIYVTDAWYLNKRVAEIEAQVVQLSDTFRRENENFEPILADSHEMKITVDTGDYILSNRLPVPWVMQQIGNVMGDFPDIQIERLAWAAESLSTGTNSSRRRSDRPIPVAIPAISAVSAEISASIRQFDGNLRLAFERIDALAAALQTRTTFSNVIAVEYPLDARPQASISGEIVARNQGDPARFRLLLTYPLQALADESTGTDDEAI